jgi:DnaJ-domain-containing protein 1
MGSLFDRISTVVKSYFADESDSAASSSRSRHSADPDLASAFDELNDFLGSDDKQAAWDSAFSGNAGASARNDARRGGGPTGVVPDALRPDFAELGLDPGADAEACKAAYKRLLKIHHPDRHAGHAANMKKATEKSARINAAFDRISQWRETGKVGL